MEGLREGKGTEGVKVSKEGEKGTKERKATRKVKGAKRNVGEVLEKKREKRRKTKNGKVVDKKERKRPFSESDILVSKKDKIYSRGETDKVCESETSSEGSGDKFEFIVVEEETGEDEGNVEMEGEVEEERNSLPFLLEPPFDLEDEILAWAQKTSSRESVTGVTGVPNRVTGQDVTNVTWQVGTVVAREGMTAVKNNRGVTDLTERIPDRVDVTTVTGGGIGGGVRDGGGGGDENRDWFPRGEGTRCD